MKHVSLRDLERTQTGTTDHPHAAATGSGCMADDTAPAGGVYRPEGTGDTTPTGRTPEERAADAWTGQYPDAPVDSAKDV
jgi:hypothetical protein